MKKLGLGIGVVLVILLGIFFQPFGHNSYGEREVIENPFGRTSVQFEQGVYWKGFASKTTTYKNVATMVYTTKEHQPNVNVSFIGGPISIRFSDAALATAEATIKLRLPNSKEQMLLIHRDNRTFDKFVISVLEPYVTESLNYSAQIMESETHYSGGKSKMTEDFQSQLEEGQYIIDIKTEYVIDETTNSKNKITRSFIRSDENDVPIRRKSNLKQYGITVATATIKGVDYDPIIDEKLAAKIEASTRESISKQLAITAEQEALTAKMEGEKLIAVTRAKEEALKLEAVIQAEKEADVAAENLKRDKLKAQSDLAIKRANAEGDRLKVAAGLTPKEAADYKMRTAIGVAEALSKRPVPTIVTNGSGNQSGLANSYTMEQMLLVQKQLSKQ